MRKRQLIAAGAAVVTTAAATVLLAATTGQAAAPEPTLGSLSVSKAAGLDIEAPSYTTSAPCTDDSDGYQVDIYGPGGFAKGLVGTTVSDAGFSTTQAFSAPQTFTFKDIAVDNSTVITPGKYTVVLSCVYQFEASVKGTFTTSLFFTDATHWQLKDPTAPPTTTTTTTTTTEPTTTTTQPTTTTTQPTTTTTQPTTTEPTTTTTEPTTTTTEPTTTTTEPTTTTTQPTTTTTEPTTTTTEPTTTTTEPTTTTTEPTTTTTQPTTTQPTTTQPTTTTTQPTTTTTTVAPTTTTDPDEPPLLGLLTPSKTSGLDTDAPRYTTPKPCNAGSDGYRMDIVGPGGFANGLNMTAVTDAGFSTTAPFEATQSLIFRDIAADAGTTIQPGRYTVVLSCVVQFEDRVTGFFGTVLDFTSPTAWHVVDGTNPTTPPTTPTTPPTTTSGPTSTTSGSTTADTTTTTDPGTGTVDPLPQGGTGGSGTGSAGSGSGGLASTGASVGLSVLVGVALVGFGTIAVIATRRRRAIPAPGEWPTES